jgi:uncharacterized protein (DUF2062 family)
MPRKLFERYLPAPHIVREDKRFRRVFGDWLLDPNIWHLNRHSVSGAFAIGLFMAFIPFPLGQTLAAATVAIFFRVNMPLSAALVWITNPVTMGPFYLLAIKLGEWMLGESIAIDHFELSVGWISQEFYTIWKPLVAGCMVFSVVASALGYSAIHLLWRWYVLHKLRKKRLKRRRAMAANN